MNPLPFLFSKTRQQPRRKPSNSGIVTNEHPIARCKTTPRKMFVSSFQSNERRRRSIRTCIPNHRWLLINAAEGDPWFDERLGSAIANRLMISTGDIRRCNRRTFAPRRHVPATRATSETCSPSRLCHIASGNENLPSQNGLPMTLPECGRPIARERAFSEFETNAASINPWQIRLPLGISDEEVDVFFFRSFCVDRVVPDFAAALIRFHIAGGGTEKTCDLVVDFVNTGHPRRELGGDSV